MQKNIRNWTSKTPADESMALIRQALSSHRARKIVFERAARGAQASALTFELTIDTYLYRFRLDAHLEQVGQLVLESYTDRAQLTEALQQQAYRTAWSNLRNYVLDALALVDSGVARLEQVFFPYLLNEEAGKTHYELFEERRALPMAGASTASPVTIIEEVEVL